MSLFEKIKLLFPEAGNRLRSGELMAQHTTFRIGGPADIFFEPKAVDEITQIIRFSKEYSINFTIIGKGSNILVADSGIRGIVVAISSSYSGIRISENTKTESKLFTVKAGTRLTSLAAIAAREGCSGLEFASGIPGSLGGAILMNAGAYDGCMADVILDTLFMDMDGNLKVLAGNEHSFSYRESYFTKNAGIILSSHINLPLGNQKATYEKIAELTRRRQESQPLDFPSAGSAFRRPVGFYAGKLISDCGLQGYRIGDAQVSTKHAGFIVNLGSATAVETKELFTHVQQTVFKATGVALQPEVRFIGDW